MATSVLERIAKHDPALRGRLEFEGGNAVWSEGGIVVEFAATADFRVHPGNGSMQLSRTKANGKPALHAELRTTAGRLQLLAETPADTLEGLPEIDGRGAAIPLETLLGFVASARALDVDTAQINAVAEALQRDKAKAGKEAEEGGKGNAGGKKLPPLFNLNPKKEKGPSLLRHFMPIVLPLALVAVIVAVSLYMGRAADAPAPDDAPVPDGVEHDEVRSECRGEVIHSTPPTVVVEAGRVQVQTRQSYTEAGVTCAMDESVGIGDGVSTRQLAVGPLNRIEVVARDACPRSGTRPRADTPLGTQWGPVFFSPPTVGEMLVFGTDLDTARTSNTPLNAPTLLNEAQCGPVISQNPDGLLVLEQSGPAATLYHIAPTGETRWAQHLEWPPLYGEVNGPYLLVVYSLLPDLYRYGVHDIRTGDVLWEHSQ